jgi:hypothetical protein
MIKGFSKQRGFGAFLLLALMFGASATVYLTYEFKENQQLAVQRGYKNLANQVNDIHSAALRFYRDTQRFPANMTELVNSGHFTGQQATPYGGTYNFNVVNQASGAELFTISLTTPSNRHAGAASSLVHNGQVSNSTLTSSIRAPFQSEIYTDYLQRYDDALRPEMTVMETSINVAGNDFNNVNEFDARRGDIERMVVTQTLSAASLSADFVGFGSGNNPAIRHSGSTLILDAVVTQTTGGLNLGGTLNAQNNNITGVNQLDANRVIASVGQIDDISGTRINYVQGTIDILSGQQLNYVTGTINQLSGVQLNYTNGTITTLSGNSLNYGSGTIGTLTGNSFNYSTGYAGTLSGNSLTYGSGSIGSLSGNSLNYGSGTIGTLTGNNLTYSVGQFGSVSGNTASFNDAWLATARGNNLVFSSGQVGNLSGTTLNYGSGTIGNLSGTTASFGNFSGVTFNGNSATWQQLTVNGQTYFNTVNSDTYVTGTYTADDINAGNVEFTSLTTNQIISAISSLGSASASQFTVGGHVNSGSLSTGSVTANSGSIPTISGTTATYTSYNGTTFRGGSFSGSNFVASTGDENQIRYDLDRRKAELDNCMYVTGFCLGQPPTVSLSCPSCVDSDNRSSFSATVTANISNCRLGCNYTWSLSGVTGSCPAGSIPAGGSSAVSCNVSGTVAAGSSLAGSVTLVAANSKRPEKTASSTVNVSWRNTSPPVAPFWETVKAGCVVDTNDADYASENVCSSSGRRVASEAVIVFSVGNEFMPYPFEQWHLTEPGATVVWSGDCSGTTFHCSIRGSCTYKGSDPIPVCPSLGKKTATAIVSFKGESRTFNVTAYDDTKQGDDLEQ